MRHDATTEPAEPSTAGRPRHVRALLVGAGLAAVVGLGPLAGGAAAATPTLSPTVVQSGLVHPWDIAFAPDGRMFVTERPGRIRVYASGAPGARLLRTFTIPGVRAEGEAGAMGIALHPRFGSGGFLYVCVSRMDEGQWRNQVLRYKVSASNGFSFSKYIIRRGMLAAGRHNGCRIRFSPGSLLYVTMGDAGVESRAQDPDSLNGKVLRVNSDGTIPTDNPILPGARGRSAAYTWGHRNPQGFAFRPGSSARFAAEHGPDEHDEINGIVAGRNFGWPIASGPDGPGGFVDPLWASGRPTIAPSGIAFATGAAWSSFRNHLFVATLKEQDLRRFTIGTTSAVQRAVYFNGRWGRLRAVVSGPGGALYITTSNGSNDRVVRIRPILP